MRFAGKSAARERGVTLLEAAIGVSLVASLLAIFIPTYVRGVHGSRLVEATDGLDRIGARAIAGARGKPAHDAFPDSAPLTPAAVPRGAPAVDEDGVWDKGSKLWTWTMTTSQMSDKLKQSGSMRIDAAGAGKCKRISEISGEAKVFGLGGMIESTIEKELRAGWDKSADFMNKWLREGRAK